MSMAVTGLDCLLPSVQQLHHRPPVIMDKQSFDLNKHAFDLNEAPLSDRGLDLQGATHEFASSLHPKKGGWLEMFNNMFGQDKTMIGSSPFMPCSTMLNTSFINSLSQAEKTVLTDRNIQSNGPGISRTSVSHEGQIVHDGNDVHEDKGAALNGSSELCNQRDAHGKLVLDNEVSHGNSNAHEKLLSTDDVRSNDFSVMGEQYIRVPSLHYLKQPLDANNVNISSFMSTGVPNPKPGLAQWLCTSAAPLDSGVYPCSNAGKASLPPCVLNSQDFPQSSEDFQLSMVPKTSCGTSCQIPYIWVSDTIENGDTSSQLCEGLIINHRQDDATLLLEDQNCKALAVLPKNGKGGRPEMSKALMNRERVLQGKAPRIRIIDSPDWLPTGWTTELKTRMAGSTAGTTDKYYRDPSTGRRFRSKVEVMNFLQTGRRKPKHPVTPLEGTGHKQENQVCMLRERQESYKLLEQ
ncbi:hypothetical protein KP509_21G081800 [Ceratopteris richardii]|uniref:MBD domain-containing protein n=1 Tax=Ceratopteris richardii TaxID=49495 RepID=A0A8T2SF34_CERRI|nr:hypothetical protein KP509_21G081800 [Ceratopteris richardii]